MSWNKDLNNIFDLAALHSWCTQAYQMIDEFTGKYEANSEITDFLTNKLKEKNAPQEHYIISLVLLKYFGFSPESIIELANNCLYDRINKNDLIFLKDHLFSGLFPLPEDLTYDITNRSFLSAKRAIKKAMQIDSVISKENPSMTILYMTFILFRMDMNEENRAMVAFLLLKVNVDLPDGLSERVYRYLWDYKDIIKELLDEENGVFQNSDIIKQKIIDLSINKQNQNEKIEEEISDIKKMDKKVINPDNKVPIVNRNEKQNSKHKMDESYSNLKNKSIIALQSVSLSETGTGTGKSNFGRSVLKNVLTSYSKSDFKKNSESVTNRTKTNIISIINKVKNLIQKSETGEVKTTDDEIQDVIKNAETSKDKISEIAEEIVEKNWRISLKSNKEILKSIISRLERNDDSRTTLNRKKSEIKKGKENHNKVGRGNRKRQKIYIGFIAILLLLLLLFFTIKNSYDKKSLVNKQISSNEVVSLGKDKTSVSQDNIGSYEELSKEEADSKELIPADFPIDFSIVDNKILWKVSEGESISGVYYILQELKPQLISTILEDISKMDWEELYDAFVSNNPVRDSYHVIYPSELFILPIK